MNNAFETLVALLVNLMTNAELSRWFTVLEALETRAVNTPLRAARVAARRAYAEARIAELDTEAAERFSLIEELGTGDYLAALAKAKQIVGTWNL